MWKRGWEQLGSVAKWPVASQHVSRRNALVATTALAERRRQRLEAEEFLARHAARGPRGAGTVTRSG